MRSICPDTCELTRTVVIADNAPLAVTVVAMSPRRTGARRYLGVSGGAFTTKAGRYRAAWVQEKPRALWGRISRLYPPPPKPGATRDPSSSFMRGLFCGGGRLLGDPPGHL